MSPNEAVAAAQYAPEVLGVRRVRDAPARTTARVGLVDTPVDVTHSHLAAVEHLGDVASASAHGTQMAGLVAARPDGGEGVTGVYDGGLSVAPQPSPEPGPSVLASAITDLVDAGCDVVCVPYAGPTTDALTDAVAEAVAAGCLVVTAAGNGPTTYAPHVGHDERVLCVGAVERDLRPAPYGRFGGVDVVAPGTDVCTTTLAPDRFTRVTGTSYAAALTAGVAALVHSRTGKRGDELRTHLVETARALDATKQVRRGRGPRPLSLVQAVADDA